jgi:hypothetical protein
MSRTELRRVDRLFHSENGGVEESPKETTISIISGSEREDGRSTLTFSEPFLERGTVEADLDGGAVPGPRAREGPRGSGWRRERDGARGAQQAPGCQPCERGVH